MADPASLSPSLNQTKSVAPTPGSPIVRPRMKDGNFNLPDAGRPQPTSPAEGSPPVAASRLRSSARSSRVLPQSSQPETQQQDLQQQRQQPPSQTTGNQSSGFLLQLPTKKSSSSGDFLDDSILEIEEVLLFATHLVSSTIIIFMSSQITGLSALSASGMSSATSSPKAAQSPDDPSTTSASRSQSVLFHSLAIQILR